MKNFSFEVEDKFIETKSTDSISPEPKSKLDNFLAKILWILVLV